MQSAHTDPVAGMSGSGASAVVAEAGNFVDGILVVERSATLGHLLKRTLDAASLAPRGELSNYLEAIDHLRRSADLGQGYRLLLVGAPARTTREFAALLEYLNGHARDLAVLLMAHEKTPELTQFAESRGQSS